MVFILTSLNDNMANKVIDCLWYLYGIRSKRTFLINKEKLHVGVNSEQGVFFQAEEDIKAIWINKGFHFHLDLLEEVDEKVACLYFVIHSAN